MKALALVLAITSSGSIASEVGAPNRQETKAALALATQETGASSSWAVEPFENMATSYQVQQLNTSIDVLNDKMAQDLNDMVAKKLNLDVEH